MTPAASQTRAPRVSVITIFLNEERFLTEAVESVLAQTYPHWELLLCDDGSTDGSAAIAKDYAAAHDRIRYLQHPGGANRGMSATRNLGLAHARGEYVALLDGDDVWLPHKLARQVACLDAHPEAAMVYGPSLWWHSWASGNSDDDSETALSVRPVGHTSGRRVLKRTLQLRGDPLFTCSILARRSAVVEVGGFEKQFTGLFEDQAFFSKFLLVHDVFVMPDVLDRYRQHPDSCCAVANRDERAGHTSMTDAHRVYTDWLWDYTSSHSVDAKIQRLVARERWLSRHSALSAMVVRTRLGLRHAQGRITEWAFAVARRVLPQSVRERLWERWADASPEPSS